MIRLLPTATLLNTEGLLHSAHSSLVQVQNERTAVDLFNAYNRWAVAQTRALSSVLTGLEVDRLVTTPRYWALQSISPMSYGEPLMELIGLEVEQRLESLNAALREVGGTRYSQQSKEVARVVVDTNVLLHHHHELLEMNWHGIAGEWPHVLMVVTVPVIVLEELDRLKRSQGSIEFRGRPSMPRRTAARQALRTVRELFPRVDARPRISEGSTPARITEAELHVDATDRSDRRVDLALVDLVSDLSAFAARTYLVTYDDALAFRSRATGVPSLRLDDGLDEA